jgi:hemerythrin-like domain-containing protein
MVELKKPDTHGDLLRIHRLITRALSVSTENCRSLAGGAAMDKSTHEGFVSYLRTFVNIVHGHHTLEDEIFFPFFKDRMPDVPFDEFAGVHETIKGLLEEMNSVIDTLAAGTEVTQASQRLSELLQRMAEAWHPHISSEEASFTRERVEAVASLEELVQISEEISKYNQEHSQPLELAVPFVLFNLEPEDRAIFSQNIPQFITDDLVPGEWKEKWEPMKPFLLA